MNSPGPIALRAIQDAIANIGVHEITGKNNRGTSIDIYNKAAGAPLGSPWCASFVYYRLREAAREVAGNDYKLPYPRVCWTPAIAEWAKSMGLWIPVREGMFGSNAVMRGDLCLFYFDQIGRIGHVGFVAQVEVGQFRSVEGNTHEEGRTGVDREGDGVWLRDRRWTSLGTYGGFVRLPF